MWTEIFLWLAKLLLPPGRAFRVPEPIGSVDTFVMEDGATVFVTEDDVTTFITEGMQSGGILYRFMSALAAVCNQVYTDANQISYDQLPDNPNFTMQDAVDWYRRLGLYNSGTVSLADMKLAIAQKMSWALVPLNQQNYLFVQAQLQAAGFDVYVYENRWGTPGAYYSKTPAEVLGITVDESTFGGFDFGEGDFGGDWPDYGISLCVNYLEPAKDELFSVGSSYNSTFFVAGAMITTFASVPAGRQTEFRQLLLKLKKANMAAFLFINFD